MQSQINELTSESERLSHVLDTQKLASSASEEKLQKKLDECQRDITVKVCFRFPRIRHPVVTTYLYAKTSEIDNLRHKLKQLADYDEIKRELEIMKVGFYQKQLVQASLQLCSTLSSLD